MTHAAKPTVVELYTSKKHADTQVVALLEQLLERAKNGQVHELCVVGVDSITGEAHRFCHQRSTSLIGAVSLMLQKMQHDHNSCEVE